MTGLDERAITLAGRIKDLKKGIAPFNAKFIAVTKGTNLEDIRRCYGEHVRHFGESRLSDLKDKSNQLHSEYYGDLNWHFIGNLQTNKINSLLKIKGLKYIHSVHSLKILESLYEKENHFSGDTLYYFLQVNTSLEKEKLGFLTYDELAAAVNLAAAKNQSRFKLLGLMTMGKIRTEEFAADAQKCFNDLYKFSERLKSDFDIAHHLELSMGMSADYPIALKAHANWIRIGSKLFNV